MPTPSVCSWIQQTTSHVLRKSVLTLRRRRSVNKIYFLVPLLLIVKARFLAVSGITPWPSPQHLQSLTPWTLPVCVTRVSLCSIETDYVRYFPYNILLWMSNLPIRIFINRLGIGMIKWTINCSVSQLSVLREMNLMCEFLKIMRLFNRWCEDVPVLCQFIFILLL